MSENALSVDSWDSERRILIFRFPRRSCCFPLFSSTRASVVGHVKRKKQKKSFKRGIFIISNDLLSIKEQEMKEKNLAPLI